MSDNSIAVSGGFPIAGLLGVVFITLKLLGVITWSWLWVLAPFWIPLAIGIAFLLIGGVIAASLAAIASKR